MTTHRLRPRFFRRHQEANGNGWSALDGRRTRDWESSYRERWQHDRVVRSTHGVNCTGSCSWKVHVKEGIVTWETQQTDYPSNGADVPDYEPRGCPRGASFSWYVYSPLRIRYPYVRAALLESFRERLAATGDAVDAWASIVEDPAAREAYTSQRGKGGLVRASWDEVADLVAAARVYTIKRWGPDRVVGFSPIPAMSMASYAGRARFFSLMGGVLTSFYDWYADLPPASPQVWGDQTDVPESADWWNATYLMMWGSNVPLTRTPDAHFMTEARYRGQKTVVVSPDYSDHTKFADHWLAAQPGTDGALALAMAHVILREFYVERETPYFADYAKRFTDLPFLVRLKERGDAHVAGAFLTAADLGETSENAAAKTVVWDSAAGAPAVPNGSIGFRWGDEGAGRWNLDLEGADPAITLMGAHEERVAVDLPRFDVGETEGGGVMRRGVPARRVGGHLDKPDAAARAAGFALVAVIARPIGGRLADRIGADAVLRVSFGATAVFAAALAPLYDEMVPLTVLALSMAAAFGLGTGAVFKLVAHDFPDRVGAVTGVVGAAGGLGGFFPPLVMAFVKSATGDYLLGFVFLSITAIVALVVLQMMGRKTARRRADGAVAEVG